MQLSAVFSASAAALRCFGHRRHLLRAAVDGSRTAGNCSRCCGVRCAYEGVGVVLGRSLMTRIRAATRAPRLRLATLGVPDLPSPPEWNEDDAVINEPEPRREPRRSFRNG